MARHKSLPVRWNNLEHAFALLCPGVLTVLSTIFTNISQSVSEGFHQLTTQPLPLFSSPLQSEQTKSLISTINSRLACFSSNLSLLRSFADSPVLYRGIVDRARSWVQEFESELQEHNEKFEQLLQARDDGEYILGLFVAYDRGNVGAFPTASERELWECYVAEVCEEMGLHETQLGEDAVEALQVLAEGYTAWFLGLVQDASEFCIGSGELDWDVWQTVKSQYAIRSATELDEGIRRFLAPYEPKQRTSEI